MGIGISSTTRNQPHFNQNQTSRDNFLTSTSTTISHFTMSSTYSQPQSHFSSSPSQEYDIESSFTLSAYTREMHQHTKKQMEAASRIRLRCCYHRHLLLLPRHVDRSQPSHQRTHQGR